MVKLDTAREWITTLTAFSRFFWSRFEESHCAHSASALSYTTLLALVPLLALSLAIFAAFPAFHGISDKVLGVLFENLVPAAEETVLEYLRTFADKAKALTGPGILFLIITALMLMATIEKALNEIWRAPPYRAIHRRLIIYWAVLTLGPLLMGAGIAVTSQLMAMTRITGDRDSIGWEVLPVLPLLLEMVAFTMLYLVVPNTRVRVRMAIWGGLLSASLFEVAKMGFAYYITHFPTYEAIYGALAAMPIFLVWVYLSWLVTLVGALFTYCISVFHAYAGVDSTSLPEHDLILAYRILHELWQGQQRLEFLGEADLTIRIPWVNPVQLGKVLGTLRRNGWAVHDDRGHWLLCRDPHLDTLLDLYRSDRYFLPPPGMATKALQPLLSNVDGVIDKS
ncbi:MAG TPA: YihY family inner membrane protein, partial [Gammaproteobacteria bacterium]|nr:YihY family inner membrane protein [Gammaproteobacteria bacterium]